MIVLGIETATAASSCALEGPTGTLASFEAEGRRHTEVLAPGIEEVCRRAGLALPEVDAIAVDVGPGLFTGLRVGLATAAALASALHRPALGLSSTDVLAEPHHRPGRTVVAVVDVRRAEVAWARYPPEGGGPVAPPALASPEDLRLILWALAGEVGELLVVGDGALRYQEALAEPVGPGRASIVFEPSAAHPSAVVLAALARRRLLDGVGGADTLAPMYLRQADVRIGWASRGAPAGEPSHAAPAEGSRS